MTINARNTRFRRALIASWTPVVLILVVTIVAFLITLVPKLTADVIQGLIVITLVVGLYIFVGNSGVISFGHAAFIALGAYLGGILAIPTVRRAFLVPGLPDWLSAFAPGLWPTVVIAALVAAVIGWIVALPLARLAGMAAAVATLALLMISQVVLIHWDVLSKGGGTISGIPVDVTLPIALVGVDIAILAAWLFQRSSTGARLRASRDDQVAARSIGVKVSRERRRAFALSAAISAVGGVLYVHSVGVLTPGDYYLSLAFLCLASLVIGGMGSLTGAVVGGALLAVLDIGMRRIQVSGGIGPLQIDVPDGVATVMIAVVLVFVLIRRPTGIARGRETRPRERLRTWIMGETNQQGAAGPSTNDTRENLTDV
ncbi:branched-chain amino acid ABC transporter permease [Microbacterium sp.]|uniref:branched-chain amino acid ABC transporter permease n=1 Tax=Microbacterium sp. TaxID=51671 RepID=UPI003A93DFFB